MSRVIHVLKADVLEKLKANKASHVEKWNEALNGWASDVLVCISKIQTDIQNNPEEVSLYDLQTTHKPKLYESEYDTAIGMLNLEVRSEIELTEQEYKNFYLDEWHWSENFMLSNTKYLK